MDYKKKTPFKKHIASINSFDRQTASKNIGKGGATKVCVLISNSLETNTYYIPSVEALGSLVAATLCSDHYSLALMSVSL